MSLTRSSLEGIALSLLRIIAAAVLLQYGLQKILGLIPGGPIQVSTPFSLYWYAGIIELVGGVLLVLGLFTRPVAFLLSGEMAFAYFMGHAPRGFFPLLNGGNLAVVLCFVYLYLAAAGGGSIALQRR